MPVETVRRTVLLSVHMENATRMSGSTPLRPTPPTPAPVCSCSCGCCRVQHVSGCDGTCKRLRLIPAIRCRCISAAPSIPRFAVSTRVPLVIPAMVCLVTPTNVGYLLGTYNASRFGPAANWTYLNGDPNAGLQLTADNGEDTNCGSLTRRTTVIRFVCDRKANGTGTPVETDDRQCWYQFTWNTPLACPERAVHHRLVQEV